MHEPHHVIAYTVWAVLLGALCAWEAFSLVQGGDEFPTLSDTLRAVAHFPVGRWGLFAVWMWFGWHIFFHGGHFLLRK